MQELGAKVVDPLSGNTTNDEFRGRSRLGELIFGVRIDALPESERKRLADEGALYPLTTDKDGNLRVVLRDDTEVGTKELEVLLRIEQLLIEQRNLLMSIAP